MKRFYCTICKHVKRVVVLPPSVKNAQAKSPTDRIGHCNRHIDSVYVAGRKVAK